MVIISGELKLVQFAFAWILLCLTPIAAASEAPVNTAALKGKLTITGSSTVAPLVMEIGKSFESIHPGVRIDVQSGGSSRGIADARQGLADIGMASRALKNDESDLMAHAIALDGIGVILNSANSVNAISKDQLIAIFTGKMINWKELGGRDRKIIVVNKAEGRSTLELFLQYTSLKNSDIKAHSIIGDNEQGIKTIAGNPDAIGYVSVGSAEFSAKNGVKIKLLQAGQVPASTENIKNGSYELSRPLNLLTKGKPSVLAQKFIEYAQSEKAHGIVQSQYFVPIGAQLNN
jgi:phosphate transport system substrate-binding protein